MELRQLEYFAAVARHLHFTRAADELHVAQPALSQQVRRLEAELGVPLLVRTTRRVQLTEAGELLLARVARALAEIEAARSELAELTGVLRGRVQIGAMQTLERLDLPSLIAAFHREHAGVEIVLREMATAQMQRLLRIDELDCAFLTITEDLDPALEAAHAYREELVVVSGPSSRWAGRRRVRMADLRDEPFVFFAAGTGLRAATVRLAAEAGFTPRVAFETNELSRVRALAAHGLGVGIVPREAAEAPGRPVAVASLAPRAHRDVGLAWRAERRASPAAAAFLRFARERLPVR